MAQNKDQLNKLLNFVEELTKQPGNEWFVDKLRKLVGGGEKVNNIFFEINNIRQILEIRGYASISYDFVKDKRLRNQLLIDNLRMENAALNLKEKEIDRFYIFCINAFYQIENVVNYYFHTLYRDSNSLLDVLENATKEDKYKFTRSKKNVKEENVCDIPISYKLNAISNILFPQNKSLRILLSDLRKVRNQGEHRWNAIYEEKDENNPLYKFSQRETFNSVRISLKKLVTAIENSLNASSKTNVSVMN